MPVRTRTEGMCRALKNIMYSQCQDLCDLSNVPDHLMNITTAQEASTEVENSTNCPNRSNVIFNDFIKERLGEIPQSISRNL